MIVYFASAACAVGVVALASMLVRRTRRATDDADPDGPTVSHAGAMLSALFLLAFAIAVIVPWTTADAARAGTYAETQAISETYWAAARLPPAQRDGVRSGLRAYVDTVRDPEWDLMADGRLTPAGWTLLDRVRRDVIAFEADDDELREARAGVLDHLGQITEARHQRAMDARTEPPAGLTVVTVVTGVVVVLLPFLAGASPRGATLVPLALMAALLAAGTYLTIDIARPFEGALAVGPEAFVELRAELQRIDGGG
ncbi:DUF4239 domain-containing protein [Actinomadura sp. WMMB 499]|uniref:bestrophin-like domain n=1 Tax=Actinomadura sp. WMMB 499 TaxID=1219491 RepID=UPI0012466EB1|nr:DUF4239 domain-containing protein [Actinomadura sp. WMMB 499]QFG19859.1 DUF4239 domain-containing protein [Actinomadura sp. WMMB 499]